MNIWSRLQLLNVHYRMGSITKSEFIHILGQLYEEAR